MNASGPFCGGLGAGNTPNSVAGDRANRRYPLDPIAGGRSLLGRAVMSTRPSFLFARLILHGIAARACETLHSRAALRFLIHIIHKLSARLFMTLL